MVTMLIEWRMNEAGDWEAFINGQRRYRAEQWGGSWWLSTKPPELSPYSELIGSYDSFEDCKQAVLIREMIES